MSALLQLHPELQTAFHGIWVHANQGDSSLFALELPMSQITALPTQPAQVRALVRIRFLGSSPKVYLENRWELADFTSWLIIANGESQWDYLAVNRYFAR